MASPTARDGTRLTTEERRWVKVLSTLNEAQGRWFVADKALDLGRGGVSRLSQVTGMSRMTITKAVRELRERGALQPAAMGRIRRREGAGRTSIEESAPEVTKLIAGSSKRPPPVTRRACCAGRASRHEPSPRSARRGHRIDPSTVGRYLHDLGYSLQANVKTREGPQHEARDEQFRYINRLVKAYVKIGDPVISVEKERNWWGNFATRVGPGDLRGNRWPCTSTTFHTSVAAKRCPMARTTSRGTEPSSTWA
jgi:transposase